MIRKTNRRADMQNTYDVVIIGGGVQGLSLAYNLARKGLKNVVVVEKSYIGSGASGRNGEMIRSAFGSEEWIRLFDRSLQLWETLSDELDFNVMFTRCGYLVLASTPDELEACRNHMRLQKKFGLHTQLLDHADVTKSIPSLNPEMAAGGILQPGGGVARHDAVVWAYEQAAFRLGVDILPFTEVKGIIIRNNVVGGVETTRGCIATRTMVNAAGGHAKMVAAMAGIKLPTEVYRLEMLVTEPLKPFLPLAVSSPNTLSYMHQTTRGEFAGGAESADSEPRKSLRSSAEATQDMARKFIGLFPGLRAVKMMRQWGGIVDMASDISPLLGPVPEIEGFVLDCGWVYGFMGSPAAGSFLAEFILTGDVPPEILPFSLSRFKDGKPILDPSLVVPVRSAQGS
jgi:sarcosine oxidase, subunit beta